MGESTVFKQFKFGYWPAQGITELCTINMETKVIGLFEGDSLESLSKDSFAVFGDSHGRFIIILRGDNDESGLRQIITQRVELEPNSNYIFFFTFGGDTGGVEMKIQEQVIQVYEAAKDEIIHIKPFGIQLEPGKTLEDLGPLTNGRLVVTRISDSPDKPDQTVIIYDNPQEPEK